MSYVTTSGTVIRSNQSIANSRGYRDAIEEIRRIRSEGHVISQQASQEATIRAAASKLQEQLDQLTAFDSHRADLHQIMGAGLTALKGSPPLSKAQRLIAAQYEQSLPPLERLCLWLYRRHGKRSPEIAQRLNVSVEWVQRTNARHFAELRMLLYPG